MKSGEIDRPRSGRGLLENGGGIGLPKAAEGTIMEILHDDPPMQDEIAAGFYPRFEDRWRFVEVCGRWLMATFVVACALGVLGQGPFSVHAAHNKGDTIAIHYEPIVRFGSPTDISFDTKVPEGGDKVAVTMAKELIGDFGLQSIIPHPSLWQAGQEGIRLEFPVTPNSQRVAIRFTGAPSFGGVLHLWARLDKGERLSWSQFSVP